MSICTLNIEANRISVLTVKRGKVERWGSISLTPGLVRDGLITNPEAVAQAINALFESVGLPKSKVIVSLTGLRSAIRTLTLPKMKGAMLTEAILRGARREMPMPLDELYLSWNTLSDKGNEQDFFVFGALRSIIDAAVQALRTAGIKPYIMELKPLALVRLVNRQNALLIDLEADTFGITLVNNGVVDVMRTVVRREEGAFREDGLPELIEELTKTVEFYNQSHLENPVSSDMPVFLTGELADDAMMGELIRENIDYPVESLMPALQRPPDLPVGAYAVNIGLALRKMRPLVRIEAPARYFDLNVLPDIYRPQLWKSARPVFLSLVVTIAILGLLPLYQAETHAEAKTAQLNAEVSRITGELAQRRLAINKENTLKETITKVTIMLEALEQEHKSILAKSGDFARMLQVVTRTLPTGVHLTSSELTSNLVTLKGETSDYLAVISYAKVLEQERTFAEVSITELSDKTFSIALKK